MVMYEGHLGLVVNGGRKGRKWHGRWERERCSLSMKVDC